MNLLPAKQLFIIVSFPSNKYRKKNLCVDNKAQETIGDVYCPKSENESVLKLQPKKHQVSTTVQSAKPAETLQKFVLRPKNLTNRQRGGQGELSSNPISL